MRKIKVYANPDDWQAYLATPHYKILSLFAEDVFTSCPIYHQIPDFQVEPISKLDSLRVLADMGVSPINQNKLCRSLAKADDTAGKLD